MDKAAVRPAGEEPSGLISFLNEALAGVFRREAVVPALLLLLLLTVSNIVIALNQPAAGAAPSSVFTLAAAFRVFGLFIIGVAILRVAGRSDRAPWRLDGAFWLYQLIAPLGLAVSALAALLVGNLDAPIFRILAIALAAIVMAPFAAWLGAIPAARPLAWNPLSWMRDFRSWLPWLLFCWMALVVPLAAVHSILDQWLVRGAGDWFWFAALFDGALSTLMTLIGFGLQAAAYRRVAQG